MKVTLSVLMRCGLQPTFSFDTNSIDDFREKLELCIFEPGRKACCQVFKCDDGGCVTVATDEIVGYILTKTGEDHAARQGKIQENDQQEHSH